MICVVTLEFTGEVPDDLRVEHRDALGRLTNDGYLLLSGPLSKNQGMAILKAPSLDDARTLYAATPLATANLIQWRVEEWDPRGGALAALFTYLDRHA